MSDPFRQRTIQLTIILCILAAFALRLYRLDAQSLWYDEGVTATLAQRDLAGLTAWTARDIQPPLYYYVVAGWGRLAGWSEWALRFVSAWWGLLTVPLLAQLTRKLTHSPYSATVAALLAAFHPLLIYYSQEARMYTMVVTLGVAAGYLFLRGTTRDEAKFSRWLIYLPIATAAVYTHYFAFFLLLAFVLFGLVDRQTRTSHLRQILGVHLGVGLFFSAWIIPLLTQLSTDRSYWQGAFKLRDAVYSVLVRFAVGETVLEANAPPYLVLTGLVTLIALAMIIQRAVAGAPTMRRTLLYAIAWLLIPVVSVLTLAYFVPKFNERYVLLALPGLLILWAVGIGEFLTRQRGKDDTVLTGQPLSVRAFATLFTLCFCFLASIHNWFTDHSFLKAQWREAAAYVRLHHEPDEAVVLVSGHAWPVWEYYAPDLPAIRLPDLEILDVDAVLDFQASGVALQDALQGYDGAWLVNWQDEVVDPTGVVPVQLAWAGTEKTFRSEFWEVGLRRFIDLDPTAIPETPPLLAQPDANFGNQLTLHGYSVTAENELLLFWQLGIDPIASAVDWQVTLQTQTGDGLPYHTLPPRRPTSYTYPVERWQPDETVMSVIPALTWAGPAAMPDSYQIRLGIYDPTGDGAGLDLLDAAGVPQGKTVTLSVSLTEQTTDRALALPNDVVQATPDVRLYFNLEGDAGEPGQRVVAQTLWYLEDSFVADSFMVRWRSVTDEQVAAEVDYPLPSAVPMAGWPRHDWLRQVMPFQVPADLPPSEYWVSLESLDTAVSASTPVRRRFTVLPSDRSFQAPPLADTRDIDLFTQNVAAGPPPVIRLLGLSESVPETINASTALTVTTVWQQPDGQIAPEHDYAISIQLLGAENRPVAQQDEPLRGGTSTWLPAEVVTQTMTLAGPLPPGEYRLIAVVYDPDAPVATRLVTAAGADSIELAPIVQVR